MSIGESLAEARRQAGLTIGQVSHETRIRESIIRDIEQNDFSACGGDFYARGHIRSIAAVVGTDPVPLISAYDAEHGPPGTIRAADVFEPSTPIKIRERRSPSLSMIVAVVLLAIIGFGAYRLVSGHGGGSKSAASLGAPTHKATASAKPTAQPVAHAHLAQRGDPAHRHRGLLGPADQPRRRRADLHGRDPGGFLADLDREEGGGRPAG